MLHEVLRATLESDVFYSRTPTGSRYFGIIYCLKEQQKRKTASSHVRDFSSNTSTHAHWLQCRNSDFRLTSSNQKRLCLSSCRATMLRSKLHRPCCARYHFVATMLRQVETASTSCSMLLKQQDGAPCNATLLRGQLQKKCCSYSFAIFLITQVKCRETKFAHQDQI